MPLSVLFRGREYLCSSLGHSKLIRLAHLYLESRLSHIISPSVPRSLPSLPPFPHPQAMNQTVHHPQQLIESSWRILDHVRTSLSPSLCVLTFDLSQATSPSLREILAAFKFSKGQDGDCQLLLAVLNAKSAEDQVICSPTHVADLQTHHASSSSEQPRSLISMRVCLNLNRTNTFLVLPLHIPFHDSIYHHPSRPLGLTRLILHPANTAILPTNN